MPVKMDAPLAVRINGQLMGNYLNTTGIILGHVNNISPDGRRVTLKTVNDPPDFIQAAFDEPVNNLEQGVLIEVVGTVLSRNQIHAKGHVQFPAQDGEQLDIEVYNKMLAYYLQYQSHFDLTKGVDEEAEPAFKTLENDLMIDWGVETHGPGDLTFDGNMSHQMM